jgi:hypothetical protein
VILRSPVSWPANRLAGGTVIRVTLIAQCTPTAANSNTFYLHLGSTVSRLTDAVVATAGSSQGLASSAATGTSVGFKAVWDITILTATSLTATLTLENNDSRV